MCRVAGDAHPPFLYGSILYNPRAPFSVVCPRPATRTLNPAKTTGVRPRARWTRVGGGLFVRPRVCTSKFYIGWSGTGIVRVSGEWSSEFIKLLFLAATLRIIGYREHTSMPLSPQETSIGVGLHTLDADSVRARRTFRRLLAFALTRSICCLNVTPRS